VKSDGLGYLVADSENRVQRNGRLLENIRYLASADIPQFLPESFSTSTLDESRLVSMTLPETILAGGSGRSLASDMQDTLFPHPLSPTSASISPLPREKDKSVTVGIHLPSVLNSIVSDSTFKRHIISPSMLLFA
jgi:hypothetical protein